MVGSREALWLLSPHLSLELTNVLVHLRNLSLFAIQVITMLRRQHLQPLVLNLVHGLSLFPDAVGDLPLVGLYLHNDAIQVEGTIFHGQHHGHDENLGLQLINLLLVQLPVKVDLIAQFFHLGLQFYLVHVSFLHILLDEDKFIPSLCAC